jgi:hypothetical protein
MADAAVPRLARRLVFAAGTLVAALLAATAASLASSGGTLPDAGPVAPVAARDASPASVDLGPARGTPGDVVEAESLSFPARWAPLTSISARLLTAAEPCAAAPEGPDDIARLATALRPGCRGATLEGILHGLAPPSASTPS